MVIAVTRMHGIAGRRDDLWDLMRRTEQRVVEEPGCRLYRFTVTLDDPDEYHYRGRHGQLPARPGDRRQRG